MTTVFQGFPRGAHAAPAVLAFLFVSVPAFGQSIVSVSTPSATNPPVASAGDLVTVTAGNYAPASVYPPATSFLDLYLNNSLVASVTAQSVTVQASVRRAFTFVIPPGLATTTPITYVIRVRATDTGNQTRVTTNNPDRTLTINPPPQITTVSPASVPAGSTATIRINAISEPFIPSSLVSFSGTEITVNNIGYVNANALDVSITIAPTAATTQRDVTVVSGTNSVTGANKLTVTPPISVSPAAMNRGVSTTLTITGFPSPAPGVLVGVSGDGLSLGTPAVNGGTITVPVSVAGTATIGPRMVTVIQGGISSTGQIHISANEASIVPVSGKQGSQVTLNVTGSGTNFMQGMTAVSVSGSGVLVGAVSVGSPTSLTVPLTISPDAEATARAITISTGAQSNTATFTVIPVSISLSPNSAGQGAAFTLTITGVNTSFGAGTSVQISLAGMTAGAPTILSPTQLTVPVAIDPGAPAGSRTITVVTGMEAPSATFSVQIPTVTLNIASGAQGTAVPLVFTGVNTDFINGITTVQSDGTGLTFSDVTVANPTTLAATLHIANNALPGVRTFTVRTANQSSTATFTVNAASIAVNPSTVLPGTSPTLIVTGTNTIFADGVTTVSISGAGVTAGNPDVTSATALAVPLAVANDAATGSRTITITTGSQQLTAEITVGIAAITANPVTVVPGTTQVINITGINTSFAAGVTTVSVSGSGGLAPGAPTVASPTLLTVPLTIAGNAPVGPRTLTVTTGAQQLSTTITVEAAAISMNPSSARQGDQVLGLLINGINTAFNNTTTVQISGSGATLGVPVVNSGTRITVPLTIAANAAPDTRIIEVVTGAQSLSAPFAIVPSSISISPPAAQPGTSPTITINGENTTWTDGTVVEVSGTGVSAGAVQIVSGNVLNVPLTIAANAAAGVRTITVRSGTQTLTGTITIGDITPKILSISPASGVVGSTMNVIITAQSTKFTSGALQAEFGAGVTVNSVTPNSDTQLSANLTIGQNAAAGVRDVGVRTGALTLTAAGAFSIIRPVSSQPFTCTAASGVPPLVRAEGYTELLGDFVLTCTGGTAGLSAAVNLQVFLNINVTSRRLGNDETEVLLIVDETATPVIYSGHLVLNNENAIVWPNVLVVQPGPGVRTFRIANLRASAAGLGTSSTLIPTHILAYISASPGQSIPIENPQQVVGYVQTGMLFDVRSCTGESLGGDVSLFRCMGQNNSGTTDVIAGTNGNMQFALRFREGFQTAFTQPFATGGASSGTRLQARFDNIPAGVRVFVTTGPSFGSSTTVKAALVNNGTLSGFAGDKSLFCPIAGTAAIPSIEIPIVNGSATADWEITASNPATNESVTFGVAIAYAPSLTSNLPAVGTSSVTGSFAPAYPAGVGAERGSVILPVPRFVESAASLTAFRIDACTTALLFPFLTSAAGFDTGIAISNNSRDPFANPAGRLQSGACTFHFYGSTPSRQTTDRTIGPGETITAVLSTGGTAGLRAVPAFTGYAIVECDFLYAHGFALITDGPIGAARVAEGYLALVLHNGLRASGVGEARGH